MKLCFPSVTIEDFDFEADWLVKALDSETHRVRFLKGQGKKCRT